jgi:hypothetical protein
MLKVLPDSQQNGPAYTLPDSQLKTMNMCLCSTLHERILVGFHLILHYTRTKDDHDKVIAKRQP